MANIHDVNESLQVQPSVRNLPTLIALSQGENGRSLQFRMVGATIPSGSSASLSGTKPDGVVYSKAGTVDGNTVIFQEDVQLTAVAGAWDAKIHIVNSGNSVATALIRFIIDPDPVAAGAVPSNSQLEGIVAECQMYAETARSAAYGSPLTASAAADMIDTSKVYVYTGSETGYTAGHWYYYNGTAWADGGVYNSIAIQTDTTLTLPDHAADAKATGDAIKAKAVTSLAERLYGGEYTSESEPYHFRQAPEWMGAKDETIVGGSLVWNQLVQNGNFGSGISGWQTIFATITASNGVLTAVRGSGTGANHVFQYINTVTNHVLFGCAVVQLATSTSRTIMMRIGSPAGARNNVVSPNIWTMITTIKKSDADRLEFNIYGQISSEWSEGDAINIKKCMCFDLTQMFGTTIADYIYSLEQSSAGAGVALVKRYIDLDTYHEYDAGSIKSVEGLESHDVVGFNQWDEEWEVGGISSISGQNYNSTTTIRTKNYIHVIPNTRYFTNLKQFETFLAYDENKNFIGSGYYERYGTNGYFCDVPENGHFIRWAFTNEYGLVYKNDVCFNLSDPSRNGTYEPYEKHSYPLDSSVTLRGVPKLVNDHIEFDGDKYRADGSMERRYGIVVLDGTQTNFYVTVMNNFTQVSWNDYNNIGVSKAVFVSDKFVYADAASGGEGNIYPSNSAPRMYFGLPSTVTTAAQAQAWFASNPTTIVYPLATPTTETAQPFQSPMIVGATEEYISDSVVPVGHESRYYEDVAKKVNGLPKDFSTLIAPVEVAYTATRNYSVGNYLIVKNQLYKVTSAISSGGTITPNSNVTATTIMAEILALA